MRLVCPNCSAQYEIDGTMIPDEGRDVQCSNCGHTWFELPPPAADFGDMAPEDFGGLSETTDEDDLGLADPADGDAVDEADAPEASAADEPMEEASASDDDDEAADEDSGPSGTVAAAAAAALRAEDPDEFPPETTPVRSRRPADAAALDILREEAERELTQRRAGPSESIETQTDMGLEDIQRRQSPSRALRARMAHLGEDDTEQEPKTDADDISSEVENLADAGQQTRIPSEPANDDDDYEAPQRDLLPDIDEINSTLKPARSARQEQQQRGGFMTGFLLMLLLAAALIIAYAMAPSIAEMFPGAEGTLISYVDRANAVRDWINGMFGQ